MTDSFERACEEADEKEKKKKETQAQKLAKLAAQRTYRSDDADSDDWQDIRLGGLFHTSDQVAYADVECLGHRQAALEQRAAVKHQTVLPLEIQRPQVRARPFLRPAPLLPRRHAA